MPFGFGKNKENAKKAAEAAEDQKKIIRENFCKEFNNNKLFINNFIDLLKLNIELSELIISSEGKPLEYETTGENRIHTFYYIDFIISINLYLIEILYMWDYDYHRKEIEEIKQIIDQDLNQTETRLKKYYYNYNYKEYTNKLNDLIVKKEGIYKKIYNGKDNKLFAYMLQLASCSDNEQLKEKLNQFRL